MISKDVPPRNVEDGFKGSCHTACRQHLPGFIAIIQNGKLLGGVGVPDTAPGMAVSTVQACWGKRWLFCEACLPVLCCRPQKLQTRCYSCRLQRDCRRWSWLYSQQSDSRPYCWNEAAAFLLFGVFVRRLLLLVLSLDGFNLEGLFFGAFFFGRPFFFWRPALLAQERKKEATHTWREQDPKPQKECWVAKP